MKNKVILSMLALISLSFFSCGQNNSTRNVVHDTSAPMCTVVDKNNVVIQGVEISFYNDQKFSSAGYWGRGGIYTKDEKDFLITANHLFDTALNGYFFILSGKDTLYVSKNIENRNDVSIVELSKTKTIFRGTFNGDIKRKNLERSVIPFKNPTSVFSICGDTFSVVGANKIKNDNYVSLMIKKESQRRESGSIFIDESGNLYVLSSKFDTHNPEAHYSILQPVRFTLTITDNEDVLFIPRW